MNLGADIYNRGRGSVVKLTAYSAADVQYTTLWESKTDVYTCLLYTSTGAQIVYRAVEAPLRQLASNAGREGALIVAQVKGMKTTSWLASFAWMSALTLTPKTVSWMRRCGLLSLRNTTSPRLASIHGV